MTNLKLVIAPCNAVQLFFKQIPRIYFKASVMSDKTNVKEKMFRIMEEIAWLPPQNEYDELNTDTVTGDVRSLSKLGSPAQQKALSRINSQREFNEAFEMWFSALGFDDPAKKGKIKIATSVAFISEVLKKNGIKY